MIDHAALWDTINEGGEGYRPAYAARAAKVASKTNTSPAGQLRMLRDASGHYVPEAKVRARLAANEAKIGSLTNASAIEIIGASIAADRALLGA